MDVVVSLSVGVVAAVLLTPLVRRFALRHDIVDRPGALKTQRAPVAYLGGVAVTIAAAIGPIVAGRPVILVPIAGALLLGLADDLRPLPVLPRIVLELGIAALAAATVPGPLLVRVADRGPDARPPERGQPARRAGRAGRRRRGDRRPRIRSPRRERDRCGPRSRGRPGRVPRLEPAAGSHLSRRRRSLRRRYDPRAPAGAEHGPRLPTGPSGGPSRCSSRSPSPTRPPPSHIERGPDVPCWKATAATCTTNSSTGDGRSARPPSRRRDSRSCAPRSVSSRRPLAPGGALVLTLGAGAALAVGAVRVGFVSTS